MGIYADEQMLWSFLLSLIPSSAQLQRDKPKSEDMHASRRDTGDPTAVSLTQMATASLLLTSISVRTFQPKADFQFQEQEILVCNVHQLPLEIRR